MATGTLMTERVACLEEPRMPSSERELARVPAGTCKLKPYTGRNLGT